MPCGQKRGEEGKLSQEAFQERQKTTKRSLTSRGAIKIVWPITVRDNVVPEAEARVKLRTKDVDLVEEENEACPKEQWVGNDGLPEEDGIFLQKGR